MFKPIRPTRQFFKNYKLPVEATLIFIGIVLVMFFGRVFDHLALADVLGSKNTKDYSVLLNKEKADTLKKNDVNYQEESKQTTGSAPENKSSSSSSSTPFTVSPSPSSSQGTVTTPSGTSSGSGGVVTPPAPFSADIQQFVYYAGPITCLGGTGSGSNITQLCSIKYTFRATVHSANGPGLVSYRWQSSTLGIDESNGFSVSSGESLTPITKEVSLNCPQAAQTAHVIKIVLTNPNSNSKYIQFTHQC